LTAVIARYEPEDYCHDVPVSREHMTNDGRIRSEIEGPVATVTLDHPPLNAMTRGMHEALAAAFLELSHDESVRAVVLAGSGERAFSVGSDINEFEATAHPGGGRARSRRELELANLIDFFPRPVIAAIHGWALGGGLELALACDLRIAEASAQLGMPEIKLGCFPGGGGTERLPWLIGPTRAKELMWLGEPVDAETAQRIGLVDRVVGKGEGLIAARGLASELAARPGVAVKMINQLVDESMLRKRLAEEALARVPPVVDEVFLTDDLREGAAAFFEKRAPRFTHRRSGCGVNWQ
jgi:enoyl-CoA hydratase